VRSSKFDPVFCIWFTEIPPSEITCCVSLSSVMCFPLPLFFWYQHMSSQRSRPSPHAPPYPSILLENCPLFFTYRKILFFLFPAVPLSHPFRSFCFFCRSQRTFTSSPPSPEELEECFFTKQVVNHLPDFSFISGPFPFPQPA